MRIRNRRQVESSGGRFWIPAAKLRIRAGGQRDLLVQGACFAVAQRGLEAAQLEKREVRAARGPEASDANALGSTRGSPSSRGWRGLVQLGRLP
jgi:hypothetical protein